MIGGNFVESFKKAQKAGVATLDEKTLDKGILFC